MCHTQRCNNVPLLPAPLIEEVLELCREPSVLRLAARILGTEDRGDLWADDHFIGKTLDFWGIPAYKTMNLLLGVGNIKMKGVLLGC